VTQCHSAARTVRNAMTQINFAPSTVLLTVCIIGVANFSWGIKFLAHVTTSHVEYRISDFTGARWDVEL
jgi:hypothetical protein